MAIQMVEHVYETQFANLYLQEDGTIMVEVQFNGDLTPEALESWVAELKAASDEIKKRSE